MLVGGSSLSLLGLFHPAVNRPPTRYLDGVRKRCPDCSPCSPPLRDETLVSLSSFSTGLLSVTCRSLVASTRLSGAVVSRGGGYPNFFFLHYLFYVARGIGSSAKPRPRQDRCAQRPPAGLPLDSVRPGSSRRLLRRAATTTS